MAPDILCLCVCVRNSFSDDTSWLFRSQKLDTEYSREAVDLAAQVVFVKIRHIYQYPLHQCLHQASWSIMLYWGVCRCRRFNFLDAEMSVVVWNPCFGSRVSKGWNVIRVLFNVVWKYWKLATKSVGSCEWKDYRISSSLWTSTPATTLSTSRPGQLPKRRKGNWVPVVMLRCSRGYQPKIRGQKVSF